MDILSQQIALIIGGTAFVVMISAGIIVLFLAYQKKQLKFILEREDLKNQFQKELLKTKMEAQEEALNHVGKELHDNIGQLLSSSKMLIATVERLTPSEALQVADKTLSQAITELRALSKSLNTDWLEKFNFVENLKVEIERLTTGKHLDVSFHYAAGLSLPSDKQIILFRMVQEAFQNSIKHGNATSISVDVEQAEKSVSITITDDGIGFKESDIKPGVGMLNIKHRSQLLGGTAHWTELKKGTQVCIQLPAYAI